jgi:sulfate adenylyltransferase
MSDHLIHPHGGALVDLVASEERAAELKRASRDWPSWDLTPRQICDLELLLTGGFSPLRGFMGKADYESVCASMRLADGSFWPIPVALDLPAERASALGKGDRLGLRDSEGVMLAVLHVSEVYTPDRDAEVEQVFGTRSREHPGVQRLLGETHDRYVAGTVEGLHLPTHYDFRTLRKTPADLRREFARQGWRRVVGFGTRNPMFRAQHEVTLRAAKQVVASLLLHPAVGLTRPGDVDHFTRVRCYQALLGRYPQHTVKLALLPLALRLAGPREALWHAIIRQNHGCTHFVIGPDHAGAGRAADGRPFYDPSAAQELARRHQGELSVQMLCVESLRYVDELDAYLPESEVPEEARTLAIGGAELRRRLAEGREIPEWFSFAEVTAELRKRHPPRHRQGFTVFFTGLSGAGKSTIANVLRVKLLEMGGRPVTLLDGDVVRKHLSSELGFSKEHRDINIRRIGFVASEITKNGGIAICAPIAPYDAVRQDVRRMVAEEGGFVLVHVATPLEVCEQRDRKGLYAKARAGLVKEFTGVSDPYEEPGDADVTVGADLAPEEAAQEILLHLEAKGFIGVGRAGATPPA